jgi:hypothetical protein
MLKRGVTFPNDQTITKIVQMNNSLPEMKRISISNILDYVVIIVDPVMLQ